MRSAEGIDTLPLVLPERGDECNSEECGGNPAVVGAVLVIDFDLVYPMLLVQ